jgi:large subunit ribosomal protein L35Ae
MASTKGIVVQFRRGRKNYKPRHFLIEVDGIDSRDVAAELVGSKVVWTSDGKGAKKINGVVSSAHGNNGVIRAIFERGLPGQAIGTEVEIAGEVKKKAAKKVGKKVEEAKEEVKEVNKAPKGVPSENEGKDKE